MFEDNYFFISLYIASKIFPFGNCRIRIPRNFWKKTDTLDIEECCIQQIRCSQTYSRCMYLSLTDDDDNFSGYEQGFNVYQRPGLEWFWG